jgi:hypothetical protein
MSEYTKSMSKYLPEFKGELETDEMELNQFEESSKSFGLEHIVGALFLGLSMMGIAASLMLVSANNDNRQQAAPLATITPTPTVMLLR